MKYAQDPAKCLDSTKMTGLNLSFTPWVFWSYTAYRSIIFIKHNNKQF